MKLKTSKASMIGRKMVLPIIGETEIANDGSFEVPEESVQELLNIEDLGLTKVEETTVTTIQSTGTIGLGGPPPSTKLDVKGQVIEGSQTQTTDNVVTPKTEATKPGPKPGPKPTTGVTNTPKTEVVKTPVEGVVEVKQEEVKTPTSNLPDGVVEVKS